MKVLSRFLTMFLLSLIIIVCVESYTPSTHTSFVEKENIEQQKEEKKKTEKEHRVKREKKNKNPSNNKKKKKEEDKKEDTVMWEEKPVYAKGRFKPYMDGCCITDTTSQAYKQLQKMYIDSNGCYRDGDYVGIAVASFYGKVGDRFKITLSSGQTFYGIMTDTKQSRHVDECYADANGGLVEFIVDTNTLLDEALYSGSLDCIFSGDIIKIERMIER